MTSFHHPHKARDKTGDHADEKGATKEVPETLGRAFPRSVREIDPHLLWGGDRLILPIGRYCPGVGAGMPLDPHCQVEGQGRDRVMVLLPGQTVLTTRTIYEVSPSVAEAILAERRLLSKSVADNGGDVATFSAALLAQTDEFLFEKGLEILHETYESQIPLASAQNPWGLSTEQILACICAQQDSGVYGISTCYGLPSGAEYSRTPYDLRLTYLMAIPAEKVALTPEGHELAAASSNPCEYGFVGNPSEAEITLFGAPPPTYLTELRVAPLPTPERVISELLPLSFKTVSAEVLEKLNLGESMAFQSLLRPLWIRQHQVTGLRDVVSFLSENGFAPVQMVILINSQLNNLGFRLVRAKDGSLQLRFSEASAQILIPETVFQAGFDRDLYESYLKGVPVP